MFDLTKYHSNKITHMNWDAHNQKDLKFYFQNYSFSRLSEYTYFTLYFCTQ